MTRSYRICTLGPLLFSRTNFKKSDSQDKGERSKVYMAFCGAAQRIQTFGRTDGRSQDNIKMDLR